MYFDSIYSILYIAYMNCGISNMKQRFNISPFIDMPENDK